LWAQESFGASDLKRERPHLFRALSLKSAATNKVKRYRYPSFQAVHVGPGHRRASAVAIWHQLSLSEPMTHLSARGPRVPFGFQVVSLDE
jgi:hypothetical protein